MLQIAPGQPATRETKISRKLITTIHLIMTQTMTSPAEVGIGWGCLIPCPTSKLPDIVEFCDDLEREMTIEDMSRDPSNLEEPGSRYLRHIRFYDV